jgi:photosystem II stability/assembly factor-like uncharacterized protein
MHFLAGEPREKADHHAVKDFKMNRNSLRLSLVAGALLAAGALPASAQTFSVSELQSQTHVHGLAVDRQDPNYLLIATHHGLFRAGPDGKAERVSVVQDFMGFTAHPSDPATLYASGHPAEGGNLGLIASTDRGRTWEQISPGVDGPVDFHQLTVSPADPETIYGAYGALQVSHDAGKNWTAVGALPDKLIDLAASAKDASTLYAATESGLLVSRDDGATWESLLEGPPVSMVEVAPDGTLYAFVLGRGIVSSAEDPLNWRTVSSEWGDQFLLHLAIDPGDPDRLFGATQHGLILASTDGGKAWTTFGG